MTSHTFCGALETPALQGVENRHVLLRPGPDALKSTVAAVLDQSAQAVLLPYCLDQEGVAAEAGDRLVKRGVEVIGPSPVDGPAPARQIDELQMVLAQLLHSLMVDLEIC